MSLFGIMLYLASIMLSSTPAHPSGQTVSTLAQTEYQTTRNVPAPLTVAANNR